MPTASKAHNLADTLAPGRILHWLERPTNGLRRVWQSICTDRRPVRVSLRASAEAATRYFGGGTMPVARSKPALRDLPEAGRALRVDPRARELARLLLAAEPKAAISMIEKLRSDGRSLAELCAGLFEPAARAMGELWQSDSCTELQVSVGLGRLQVALRTASRELSSAVVPLLPTDVPHAVLVAPFPREQHVLGSSMASELFARAGWDVSCEFPESNAALGRLVHDRWFDVLDLSLSSVFTREHRLPELAASIKAAHVHSRNPALAVIVDGRVFNERPWAYAQVGADACSGSVMELIATAQRQFQHLKLSV